MKRSIHESFEAKRHGSKTEDFQYTALPLSAATQVAHTMEAVEQLQRQSGFRCVFVA